MSFRLSVTVLGLVFALCPGAAVAAPPSPDVMDRLAKGAVAFDQIRKRASYAFEGHLDRLDGDGKPTSVKRLKARVESDGKRGRLAVMEYVEDGEDKTAKAQKEARENDAKSDKEREKTEVHSPLLPAEQARYLFDVVSVDTVDPSRILISFVPKDPDQHSIEGSGWVNALRGTLISASFKVSKPGLFVDHVHFVIEFGADTDLGPSVSKITMDANGGFLFFRKHVHGEAMLSNYRIVP